MIDRVERLVLSDSQKIILTLIKGYNSVTNKQNITGNNPNLDLVKINAYTKFGQVLSICSKILSGYEILTNQGPYLY